MIALVAEQIKADFGISDFQIGLLGGTAFAVINVVASLPLARLAERYSRKFVCSLSLLFGSLFTMACGVAGNFGQLVLVRIGMAGGSAGTEAPPHSMISDMYPPEKRASAMSLFMLGVPAAAFLGSALGGAVAASHGWRATFYVIGGLGALVALAALWLVQEPKRGDHAVDGQAGLPAGQVLKMLLTDRCLRQILLGVSIISLGAFGINTFMPAYFARNFSLDVGQTGLVFGALSGLASAIGTLLGGYGSEWAARRDGRLLLALPGLGGVIGAPVFIIGLFQSSLTLAFTLMLLGSIFFYMAMGPCIAALHGLLDSRSRATGSAIFLTIMYLAGQGFGPPMAGFVSDHFSAWTFGSNDFGRLCVEGRSPALLSSCAVAGAAGVRFAIACFAGFYIWAGAHLVLAARARKA